MPAKPMSSGHRSGSALPLGITPLESAQYTKDLLISLHGVATHQGQTALAEKLESAAAEASRIVIAETAKS